MQSSSSLRLNISEILWDVGSSISPYKTLKGTVPALSPKCPPLPWLYALIRYSISGFIITLNSGLGLINTDSLTVKRQRKRYIGCESWLKYKDGKYSNYRDGKYSKPTRFSPAWKAAELRTVFSDSRRNIDRILFLLGRYEPNPSAGTDEQWTDVRQNE